MRYGDFVRFKNSCPCAAGKWCADNGITGIIVSPDQTIVHAADVFTIKTGLPYEVFAHPSWIEVIVNSTEAPLPAKHE